MRGVSVTIWERENNSCCEIYESKLWIMVTLKHGPIKKYLMPVVCGESLTIYRLHKCVGAHVVKAHCILKYVFGFKLKSQFILLFSLFLLLFMDLIAYFVTIYRFYCIILFNFNLYLEYFQ